jgi:hypothetical protein
MQFSYNSSNSLLVYPKWTFVKMHETYGRTLKSIDTEGLPINEFRSNLLTDLSADSIEKFYSSLKENDTQMYLWMHYKLGFTPPPRNIVNGCFGKKYGSKQPRCLYMKDVSDAFTEEYGYEQFSDDEHLYINHKAHKEQLCKMSNSALGSELEMCNGKGTKFELTKYRVKVYCDDDYSNNPDRLRL